MFNFKNFLIKKFHGKDSKKPISDEDHTFISKNYKNIVIVYGHFSIFILDILGI